MVGDAVAQDGMRQIMSRVDAVLDASGCENTANARELFEYLASMIAAAESDRSAPVVAVIHHIGNFWRHWLLLIMRTGSYRPSTIIRLLEAADPSHPISYRMLTLNLRMLERDGLIERTVMSGETKHVEYSSTPLGRELSDWILQLLDWISLRSPEVTQARALFDAADANAPSLTPRPRPDLQTQRT